MLRYYKVLLKFRYQISEANTYNHHPQQQPCAGEPISTGTAPTHRHQRKRRVLHRKPSVTTLKAVGRSCEVIGAVIVLCIQFADNEFYWPAR